MTELRDEKWEYLFTRQIVKQGIIACVFETSKKRYVYDTYSNKIFEAGHKSWRVLRALSIPNAGDRKRELISLADRMGFDSVQSYVGKAQAVQDEGYCFGAMPRKFEIVDKHPVQHASAEEEILRPEVIVLNLTDECNLRCSYCLYSEKYPKTRQLENKAMSQDVAFSAIDRFVATLPQGTNAMLGFYGGEPLLSLPLLVKCMERARSAYPNCEFWFTTNGLLLNESTFATLRPFDPSIAVSLDGPAVIHDANRVTAGGAPTFHRVVGNLKRLITIDPEWAKKRLTLLGVVKDPSKADEVLEFLQTDNTLCDLPYVLHPMSQIGLVDEWDDRLSCLVKYMPKARLRYLNGLVRGDLSGLAREHNVFGGMLQKIAGRPVENIGKKWEVTSACKPGTGRIFVTTEGTLQLCERGGNLPPIGNVDQGMDLTALSRMESDFLTMKPKCRGCWVLRFCGLCYLHVYSGEGVAVDLKTMAGFCRAERERYRFGLQLHQEFLEESPDGYSRLSWS